MFDLALPQRVVFGWGRRSEIGSLAKTLGNTAICVCGSRSLQRLGVMASLHDSLRANGVSVVDTITVSREPTVEDVDDAVKRLQNVGKQAFIIVVGGGAAMDLAKAVAGMIPQPQFETVKDYLEEVGRGLTMNMTPLPILAVPTTSGTGSEATKNAVIGSFDPPFKKSLRDERLIPKIVLLDPELTTFCPAKITAESGMDAITQLFESYVSRKTQPFTQALCEQGLVLAWRSLAEAVADPVSQTARENMAYAAFLSGVCLANAGLGMAHGIAPALGTIGHVTHGAACALLLPLTLRCNAKVCQTEYARLARLLLPAEKQSNSDEILVERLIEDTENLCVRIGVPRRFSDVGITESDISKIAANSFGSSMKSNPRTFTVEELIDLFREMS